MLPRVTCDLPVTPVLFHPSWTHLAGLSLADPAFGEPWRFDNLLGINAFVNILRQGRWTGPSESPVDIETKFGWAVCGGGTTTPSNINLHVASHYASAVCSDDILHKFWGIGESSLNSPALTVEEHSLFQHFKTNYSHTSTGRLIVPFPRRPDAKLTGESWSQAVHRFFALEHSFYLENKF